MSAVHQHQIYEYVCWKTYKNICKIFTKLSMKDLKMCTYLYTHTHTSLGISLLYLLYMAKFIPMPPSN